MPEGLRRSSATLDFGIFCQFEGGDLHFAIKGCESGAAGFGQQYVLKRGAF